MCQALRHKLQYALPITGTPVVQFGALPLWDTNIQSGTSEVLIFDGAPEEKISGSE